MSIETFICIQTVTGDVCLDKCDPCRQYCIPWASTTPRWPPRISDRLAAIILFIRTTFLFMYTDNYIIVWLVMFFPKDFYIFTMVYRRIILCFSRLHVWATFLHFLQLINNNVQTRNHCLSYWILLSPHSILTSSYYAHAGFIQYVWTMIYSIPLSGLTDNSQQ